MVALAAAVSLQLQGRLIVQKLARTSFVSYDIVMSIEKTPWLFYGQSLLGHHIKDSILNGKILLYIQNICTIISSSQMTSQYSRIVVLFDELGD